MKNQSFLRKPELGQIWTPVIIAKEMACKALASSENIIKILDPACGPATFSYALSEAGANNIHLDSCDVDERMTKFTSEINKDLGFHGATKTTDYLADISLAQSFDLVIMNPPYLRQESISSDSKNTYHEYLRGELGVAIDRRANLFALFMLKGIVDLVKGGILCAIVYDAVSQTGYGKKTLAIISRYAELLSSKQLKAPFDGVLVDAQILIFKKHAVASTEIETNVSVVEPGCTLLSSLLKTRRGTALPKRKAYLAVKGEPFIDCSVPFFMKQSKLKGLIVETDERAYLTESLIGENSSDIVKWLKMRAELNGINLAKTSVPAVRGDIVFNYYIRNAPRHLWNKNNIAISDNFYVSIAKGGFPNEVAWLLLNSDEYLDRLIKGARSQGAGLKKLQLYEYKQVQVPDWHRLSKRKVSSLCKVAIGLITDGADYSAVRAIANKQVKGLFND